MPGSGVSIPTASLPDIKGDGQISVPEIGRIQAEGKTPGELEKEIESK